MKYTVDIEINKPVEEVVALFDNVDNLYKWMEGLQSFEHLSGEAGKPGAKSRLHFKTGKRDLEMIETIKVANFPEEFTTTYEAKGVFNLVTTRFSKVDDQKTKYISEQEFQLKGFMKIIGFLMPGAFKKQSMKYLRDFKSFAESV